MREDNLPSAARSLKHRMLALRPELSRLRAKALALFTAAALAVTSAITAGLLAFYPHMDSVFPPAVLVSLLLALGIFHGAGRLYGKAAKALLVESLTLVSGFTYSPDGTISLATAKPHGILPPSESMDAANGFEGECEGAPLSLQDIALESSGRKTSGVLARIRLKRPVDGHTVAITGNAVRAYFPDAFSSYGRIGAPGRQDGLLEIFATDRAEGRLLLSHAIAERLKEGGADMKARWIAISLLKGEALVFIDRPGGLLDAPPLWSPVREDHLLAVYAQFEAIFRIVDAMKRNPQFIL